MRRAALLAITVTAAASLAAIAPPARAETRWLACKVTDQAGKPLAFNIMYDDIRNIAAVWDGIELVDGTSVAINFQSIRGRFPKFALTYNRNDGKLSMTPLGANYGGLLHGDCRRSLPPPGLPASR
jgi:hypothetical protein